MKILTSLLLAGCFYSLVNAADSPELTTILTKVDGASKELIQHTRTLETQIAKQRIELDSVSQQLANEKAARIKAEAERDAALAERDAARKSVSEAKLLIQSIAEKL